MTEKKTIWNKVRIDIKKEFNSEPINNKNFWKTKIKSCGDEFINFYDKEIICYLIITLA